MIVLEVEDLDAYWEEMFAKDLPMKFPGVKIKAPKDYPWGREMHVIDPAGVCWHVRNQQTAAETDPSPAATGSVLPAPS